MRGKDEAAKSGKIRLIILLGFAFKEASRVEFMSVVVVGLIEGKYLPNLIYDGFASGRRLYGRPFMPIRIEVVDQILGY
ncbi:8476_t:CDS:2 [Funneliformis caledonium]|uniref:8476_t:CDS:1 n=1 Tax=Funneliformis caledonium TaxID=1117310 RepID=A0A9N9ET52_9GLOM|nr:8476_t:CDS:2 [Funneliformis caledonium]